VRALVTGATGFTGTHLVRALLNAGHGVKALVRDKTRGRWLETSGVEVVVGDVRDCQAVNTAIRDTAVVYHLAAAYRVGGLAPRHYFEVNVEGTRNVVRSCLENRVARLVHCSTVGVHGEIKRPPADEDSPLRPGDSYQWSKALAEDAVWDAWREARPDGRTEMVVVRPTGIYGPGDTRLLKFFRMVARGRGMPGNGNVLYHVTYVTDVVHGMILCASRPEAPGEAFIVAGPSWCTLREWAQVIAQQLGSAPPRFGVPTGPIAFAASLCEGVCRPLGVRPVIHRRSLDFFTKDRAFSWKKARKVLGYQPKVGLAEGVRLTVQWYRERGLL
jgi:dihydroflavonol-4-reductase